MFPDDRRLRRLARMEKMAGRTASSVPRAADDMGMGDAQKRQPSVRRLPRQTSVTAGDDPARRKLPLTVWFWAAR